MKINQTQDVFWQKSANKTVLKPGQIDVWRINLSASAERYRFLHGLLDVNEQQKAAKFLHDEDRYAWVVAHGEMRLILALYLEMNAKMIPFVWEKNKKPFIQDSKVKYSLSHTHGYALLAVTNTGEVGIDIEYKRENDHIVKTSHSTFSQAERADILAVEGKERLDRFYNCWTRKEAFIKAIGLGFSYDTKSFTLSVKENEVPRFISFENFDYDPSLWTLMSFEPYPNTQAALAFAFILTAIYYRELSEEMAKQEYEFSGRQYGMR